MSDFPQRRPDNSYRGRPYLDSPYPAPPRRREPPRPARPPWPPAPPVPPTVPRATYVPARVPDLALCRRLRTRAILLAMVSGALVALMAGLLIAGYRQLNIANEALGATVMLAGLVRMGQLIARSARIGRVMRNADPIQVGRSGFDAGDQFAR